MKLYVYDHCPYCVKARMIFGLKNIPFEMKTLLNDDEKTPVRMIGKKMVPILQTSHGEFMPESMDIVSYIDQHYGKKPKVSPKTDHGLSAWLSKQSHLCYELAMPRWAKAPLDEFKTPSARAYFQKKKEAWLGPFDKALGKSPSLIKKMESELKKLEVLFKGDQFFGPDLSFDDFHLFAFLRSLSIVKGLAFPEKIKSYSESLSKRSAIPLHGSMAV